MKPTTWCSIYSTLHDARQVVGDSMKPVTFRREDTPTTWCSIFSDQEDREFRAKMNALSNLKIAKEEIAIQKHEQRFKLIWHDICRVHQHRYTRHVTTKGSYDAIRDMIADKVWPYRQYTVGEIKATLKEAESRGWVTLYNTNELYSTWYRKLHC